MTRRIQFAVVKNLLYADGVGHWAEDIDQAELFTSYCEAHDLMERLGADGVACVAVETHRETIEFH